MFKLMELIGVVLLAVIVSTSLGAPDSIPSGNSSNTNKGISQPPSTAALSNATSTKSNSSDSTQISTPERSSLATSKNNSTTSTSNPIFGFASLFSTVIRVIKTADAAYGFYSSTISPLTGPVFYVAKIVATPLIVPLRLLLHGLQILIHYLLAPSVYVLNYTLPLVGMDFIGRFMKYLPPVADVMQDGLSCVLSRATLLPDFALKDSCATPAVALAMKSYDLARQLIEIYGRFRSVRSKLQTP